MDFSVFEIILKFSHNRFFRYLGTMPPKRRRTKGPAPINREDWKRRLFERNPEIQRLKQSITPIERLQSFVDIYEPGREQIKQQLTHETIIKLVIQHLSYFGFYEARELLTKESGIDCTAGPYFQTHFSVFLT